MIGWIVLSAVIAAMAYVRLAPLDVQTWHNPQVPETGPGEQGGTGHFTGHYVQDGDGVAALARLHETALATPRTQILAGTPAEGKITYVTRSRIMGFPDLTTATLIRNPDDGTAMIQIYARLRFGKADLGVNEARVRDWVARAGLTKE